MTEPERGMQTLLIDDDPFALKLLARQLAHLGCVPVQLCERAQDAMSLLDAHMEEIGLVFCDLQMPDVDWVEFVRYLARIGFRGGVVLVSGEDARILQTVQRLAQAHGIRLLGALSKPVSPERLRQVLASNESRRAVELAARALYGAEELKRALAGGELVNHYQPKVDLVTGALVGVEALVRWQHPQAGMVFPDQFITTAEEHGLIDELTRVVLATALHQSRRWHDARLDLQVSVNVSMDNLAALDFPDVVAQLANEAGVALSGLTLEVTESRLMKDVRAPLDIVTRLRLKRIGLSIDDFGTGHSSLAQLRDIPFDELKLDRSFVNGAGRDPAVRAIVEGTLAMARQLGMKSVAEGVEDRADWDFIRALGCDVAQGYFIARPMPGDGLPDWATAWEKRRRELTVA
jgi:EAL domain-containing protein (putative c-di-GMP-specific phosphodiesterase class I)/FixJ family two-component response regulator